MRGLAGFTQTDSETFRTSVWQRSHHAYPNGATPLYKAISWVLYPDLPEVVSRLHLGVGLYDRSLCHARLLSRHFSGPQGGSGSLHSPISAPARLQHTGKSYGDSYPR